VKINEDQNKKISPKKAKIVIPDTDIDPESFLEPTKPPKKKRNDKEQEIIQKKDSSDLPDKKKPKPKPKKEPKPKINKSN